MKNKLFFISFIIMVIYFLSAVSAADVNCTCDDLEINGENNLELSGVDEACDNSSVYDENSNCINSACDTLGAVSDDISADEDCLGYVLPVVISDCADYRELQTLIYRNSVVDLDKNYSVSSDVPLKINKNITIDGHGHSIDFNSKYSSSCGIKSLKGNVVLKNLIILHCAVKDCGALFIDGSACCTLINCTFSHNTACKSGGAVFVNNKNLLKVIDSSFNYNCAQDLGGAIYSRGSVYVVNSSFYWNKAYDYGGVIYSLGRVDAINSSFTSNYAGKSYSVIRSEGVLLFKNSIATRNIANTPDGHGDQLSSKIDIIKDDSAFMDKNIAYDELSEKILNKSVVNLWLDKSDDLEKLFKFIENNNPSWNLLNITLAPSTAFKLSTKEFKETYNSYAVRLTTPVVKINGNPGSLIYGSDLSLMYVAPTCQVILCNVDVCNFDSGFVNYGGVYCNHCYFEGIKNYIAVNVNNIAFESCVFKCWIGSNSVLYAGGNSLNVFYQCDYRTYIDWDSKFIQTSGKSSVIVYSEVPLANDFQDCVFSNASTLSVISSNPDSENGTVFNCSDVDELCNVIKSINTFAPIGKVVINLEPKEYIFTCGMIKSLSGYGVGECNPCIRVGFTPIVINGNGANIKMKVYAHDVFARIGVISTCCE